MSMTFEVLDNSVLPFLNAMKGDDFRKRKIEIQPQKQRNVSKSRKCSAAKLAAL